MAYHVITVNSQSFVTDPAGGGEFLVTKLDIGATTLTSGPVGLLNPMPVRRGNPLQVYNNTLSWSNSDPALTEKLTADIDLSAAPISPNGGLIIIVRNPSTETALAGEFRNKFLDGATNRYPKMATFTVATQNADGESFNLDSGFLNTTQVSLKNSTTLSGSGAFSARVQVWSF